MNPISNITLAQLYEHINKSLKGSGIHNEDVAIVARVKLTAGKLSGPDPLIVNLKLVGVTIVKEPIPEYDRDKMSGMYPPTHKAQISIDCEIAEDEHKGS